MKISVSNGDPRCLETVVNPDARARASRRAPEEPSSNQPLVDMLYPQPRSATTRLFARTTTVPGGTNRIQRLRISSQMLKKGAHGKIS